jgi:hypothetical protein
MASDVPHRRPFRQPPACPTIVGGETKPDLSLSNRQNTIRSRPMKHRALVLSIVMMLAGCATVPARNIDRVQAGMDRDQVRSIMGQPDTVSHAPGKECAYYSLLKDFWSRVPWSVSDRYYVCFDEGKVASFGKVDAAPSG